MTRTRIAVLASGGGSNVQALIDHFAELGGARAGDIVVVASDRENAPALSRALDAGIPTAVLASLAVPEGPELAWWWTTPSPRPTSSGPSSWARMS